MERVRNLLRVLLGRALSEHGREAPALSNILIERASGRFEPRLGAYFANGYCTWAPRAARRLLRRLRAVRGLGLDQPPPRSALRGAGDLRAHVRGAPGRGRPRRASAGAWRQPCSIGSGAGPGAPRAIRLASPSRRARRRTRPIFAAETQHRLRHWWAQQRDDCARYALFGTGFSADIGSKRAQERGIQLLMENLSRCPAPAVREVRLFRRHRRQAPASATAFATAGR